MKRLEPFSPWYSARSYRNRPVLARKQVDGCYAKVRTVLAYALVLVLLAGGVWSAVDNFRIRHPVSNLEVTVPGQNGPNAKLVSGWKTTPAGRHPASGDMI